MVGATTSVEGVLVDCPTHILPKIRGVPTRELLVDLHQLVSGNTTSVLLNLGGGRHRHLTLTMTSEVYASQTRVVFVPPHNPIYYPPTMVNAQDQALRTENFRQNQALFRKYTAVDGALKIKSSRQWYQSSSTYWRSI